MQTIKCVVVGDGAVGKASIILGRGVRVHPLVARNQPLSKEYNLAKATYRRKL